MGSAKKAKGNGGRVRKQEFAPDNWSLRTLQNKVDIVKPLWDTLSHGERVGLLTVPVSDLRKRATELAWTQRQKSGLATKKALESGLARLEENQSWKRWQLEDGSYAEDSSHLRRWVESEREACSLGNAGEDSELAKKDRSTEQDNFGARMSELLGKVQRTTDGTNSQGRSPGVATRSMAAMEGDADDICCIMQELVKEHHCVRNMMLLPLIGYICGALPAGQRETTAEELSLRDVGRMRAAEVACVRNWLVRKVEGLAWRSTFLACGTQASPKVPREVDDVGLTEDKFGLSPHPRLLQQLEQGHVLRQDGQIEEVRGAQRDTLLVEWAFGSLTMASWGDKARQCARCPLGDQHHSVSEVKQQLTSLYKEQRQLKNRTVVCTALLDEVLEARRRISKIDAASIEVPWADLAKGCEDKDNTEVAESARTKLLALLERERVLLEAKMETLYWNMRVEDAQLLQCKYKFQQWNLLRDRVKQALKSRRLPNSGLPLMDANHIEIELTQQQTENGRNAADFHRYIAESRQRTAEVKKCKGYLLSVEKWLVHLKREAKPASIRGEALAATEGTPASSKEEDLVVAAREITDGTLPARERDLHGGAASVALREAEPSNLEFFQELGGPQSRREECQRYARLSTELKEVRKEQHCLAAVVPHLVAHLEDVACDDPGPVIKDQLLLPLLEERLRSAALKHLQDSLEACELAASSFAADSLFWREVSERREEDLRKVEAEHRRSVKDKERQAREVERKQRQLAESQGELEQLAAEEPNGFRDASGRPLEGFRDVVAMLERELGPRPQAEGSGLAGGCLGAEGQGFRAGAPREGHRLDSLRASGGQVAQGCSTHRPESGGETPPEGDAFLLAGRKARRRGKVAETKGQAGTRAPRSGTAAQGSRAEARKAEPPRFPERPRPSELPETRVGSGDTCVASGEEGGSVEAEQSAAQRLYQRIPPEVEDIVCCPISQELMLDAVTAEDGKTYSQAAIQQWLNTGKRISPLTNMEMGAALVPNMLIRSFAQTCLEQLSH